MGDSVAEVLHDKMVRDALWDPKEHRIYVTTGKVGLFEIKPAFADDGHISGRKPSFKVLGIVGFVGLDSFVGACIDAQSGCNVLSVQQPKSVLTFTEVAFNTNKGSFSILVRIKDPFDVRMATLKCQPVMGYPPESATLLEEFRDATLQEHQDAKREALYTMRQGNGSFQTRGEGTI